MTIDFGLLLVVAAVVCQIGFCSESPKVGGLRNTVQNSLKIDDIGRFAVQEHNKNQVISSVATLFVLFWFQIVCNWYTDGLGLLFIWESCVEKLFLMFYYL